MSFRSPPILRRPQMADMCRAALAGDAGRAHDINNRLMPLHQASVQEPESHPGEVGLCPAGTDGDGDLAPALTDLTPEGEQAMARARTTAELMASV